MLNFIWAGLIIISILCAAALGRMDQLSSSVLSGASDAVTLVISLTGMMCAWTGLMKIADKGGATRLLSRALRPVMSRLFPDCKRDGAATRAMCMNITANLLGLGNAATPLGLAAMKELKKSSPGERASNSMVLFVVLNTASIQLIPTFIATLRSEYGSASPFDILPCVWVTSFSALAVGILAAKLMEGRSHG